MAAEIRPRGDEREPLLGRTEDASTVADQQDVQGDETAESQLVAEEPSTRKLVVIFASMWLAVFINAVDSTIVATLSAPISNSFHAATLLSWLASAYLISNAALQPLTGRLTDIYGRKAGLIWSNIFFATGNLMCGTAKTPGAIIAGRVIAGMGGGGVNSISTFVASDLVPLRRRGLIQGYGNLCFGVGSSLGGVLGGLFNDSIGWRWAFLIQVPFIVVSGICAYLFIDVPVKESNEARIKRVDFLGAGLLTTSLVLLLVGLNSGGNLVPWTHPLVLVSLPSSVVVLAAFVYVEANVASEPIIPVRLMLNRTVAAACLTNWFCTMGLFAMFFYGPIFFQATGSSATKAGLRLSPYSLGIAAGSVFSGWIMRRTGRYWWLSVVTQSLMVAAALLLAATADEKLPVWPMLIYFFMMGSGYAGMLTISLLALISAVDHEHQAVITSASYAFRSTGSTIGITVASAVFQNIFKAQLWSRLGGLKGAAGIIKRIRDDIDEIKALPPNWRSSALASCIIALKGVWMTTLGFVVLGALCSLFMREHILHRNLSRK